MGPNDPLRTKRGAGNLGAGALHRGGDPTWDLADVVDYNSATHTAIVRTHRGRPLRDVPQLKTGPGAFEHLKTGTTVVVAWELGRPLIIGCVSLPGSGGDVDAPSLTGETETDPLSSSAGTSNHKPANAPTDLTEGDWARVGTHGNFFALLEGGTTLVGSPTAQIRSLGPSGVLQFIAQQLQTYTDFGQWRVENDEGRTSFILRAGSHQSTQTGLDEEHWTIRLDLGATGDLFNFEITEPSGRGLFKFHVGPDGRLTIYGDGGVDVSSGNNADAATAQDIAGQREVNVAGVDTLTVAGLRRVKVGGHHEENVTGDKKTVVGASELSMVNNDHAFSVGGQDQETVVGGSPIEAKKGRNARTTKMVNGGWLIDIGNPKDGANITAQAAFEVRTSIGNIMLMAGGPGEIHLNGDEQRAVRGDDLRATLNNFIAAYNKLVDAYSKHMHPTGVGPSGIPLPAGVPPIPNPWFGKPPPPAPPSPWFAMPYVADPGLIKKSKSTPYPLPPQPAALAIAHVAKMPESNLSKRVKLK